MSLNLDKLRPATARRLVVASLALLTVCMISLFWRSFSDEAIAAPSVSESTPLIDLPLEERSLLPVVTSIFETAAKGEIDAAVQKFSDRAWRENPRAIEQLRTILTNLNKIATKYSGTELIAVRRVSPRFTELSTISWYEQGPYLFKIRFYQKDGEWRVADFAGTNELNDFIEKAPLTFVAQYKTP